MDKEKSKSHVESPSDSREGLAKNCGGLPETLSVEEIFKRQTPPDRMAKGSVSTMGAKGGE